MNSRRVLRRTVTVVAFLAFTYVAITVTTARGPAIDIAFDLAVYIALVVHLIRRWMRQPSTDRRK